MAADDKRDRAEMCADCADLSCPACQHRLQAARAYDQMAARILQPAEASPLTAITPARPAPAPPRPARPAAGIEAGQ